MDRLRISRLESRLEKAKEQLEQLGVKQGLFQIDYLDGNNALLNIGEANENTLFDVASVSKFVLSTLVLRLVQDGKLDLQADVCSGMGFGIRFTIQDLLDYKLVAESDEWNSFRNRILEGQMDVGLILEKLKRLPYKKFIDSSEYTNMPAMLLSLLVPKLTGKSLRELLAEYFELEMRLQIPTQADAVNLNDPTARAFAQMGVETLHGGMFMNLQELAKFIRFYYDSRNKMLQESLRTSLSYMGSTVNGCYKNGFFVPGRDSELFARFPGRRIKAICKTGATGSMVILSNDFYAITMLDFGKVDTNSKEFKASKNKAWKTLLNCL